MSGLGNGREPLNDRVWFLSTRINQSGRGRRKAYDESTFLIQPYVTRKLVKHRQAQGDIRTDRF